MKALVYSIIFSSLIFANHAPLDIVYIGHTKVDHPFVRLVRVFSNAVADDLKINLNFASPNIKATSKEGNLDRYTYEKFAKHYFFLQNKPQAIVSILFRRTGKEILNFSQKSDIPVFIVNTNIPDEDRHDIGNPRSIYKTFMGLVAASEKQAGELLINTLLEKARIKKPKANIEVVGISGPREAYEAIERNSGLKVGIKKHYNVKLHQITFASWNKKTAYKQTLKLLDRYPNLDVIWTASDGMAIGAKKAIVEKQRDVIVGGIDWSNAGIEAVEYGVIDASIGGHYMNGGIALILMYDYFHGLDFKNELGLEINFNMFKLTSKNIKSFKDNFSPDQWHKIDFTKYSKALNPSLKKYNFSLENFIQDIKEYDLKNFQ